MTTFVYLLSALGAAGISAFVAWRISKAKHSGSVDTSDADALWQASEEMRKELRAEAHELRVRAKEAQERADTAEKRADQAQKEVYFLHQEVFDLRTRIARLEDDMRSNGGTQKS